MTRGISLNNPGNIRISSTPWLGKIVPSRDPDFETFDSPSNGLRAIARELRTYFERGINTIDDIISTWAPSTENNTDAYIDDVSDRAGFDSDEALTPDASTLTALVSAIVWHENGSCPYDSAVIAFAVNSALSA